MATIDVKDATGATVAIEKPLAPGRVNAAVARPVALSNEDKTALDALATAAAQTTANGYLATLAGVAKAEDAAHGSGDAGIMALAVQKASPSNLGADGDYGPLQTSGGLLWVRLDNSASVGGFGTVINVALTTDTNEYGANEVVADTQVVTGALRLAGKASQLQSLTLIDADGQNAALKVYFLSANTALGTENGAPTISGANKVNILDRVDIATSDYDAMSIARKSTSVMLTAASGTDVWVAVVNGSGTPTYSADGLTLRLGIVQG